MKRQMPPTDADPSQVDGWVPVQSVQETLSLGSGRILLAEDDEPNRRLTTSILESAGYHVVSASDGANVVPVLQEHAFDLVLLDVGLPRQDGLEVTRRIRADSRFSTLPIFLLTGRSDDKEIVAGLESGADDYITKPVEGDVLVARIASALRSRRALLGMEAAHSVVAALAYALEARGTHPQPHSERLSRYAVALGRDVGLAPEALHSIAYGAILHDLGNIGVPEAILFKPGPLDEHETNVMRRHTEIGERITAPLVGAARFGKIIRHHHERWDGHGYPDGLRAEAIPIGARIVGVVDAFDAMTQVRSYRPARSSDEAMQELKRERGRQFDPDLVDAFLRVIEWDGVITVPDPEAKVASAGLWKSATTPVSSGQPSDHGRFR
jgi:putative two-component system response regulator